MAYTISQLLAEPGLGLTPLTTGMDLGRALNWAHTSELADPTPWMTGGELLMTLGINLPSEPAGLDSYVRRLAAAGIAGLAVDIGIVLDEVPAALVAAGERHGVPILQIPPTTPFLAISRAIINGLTAESLAAVAEVSRRQDRIAAAALKSGITGIVETLAPLLTCDVVVATVDGAILAVTGRGGQRLGERLQARFAERSGVGKPALTFTHLDDHGALTAIGLRVDSGPALVLATQAREPFDAHDRLVLSFAATMLAVVLRTPDRIREVELRLRRAVGQALLSTALPPDPGLLDLLGFGPDAALVVAVLQLRDDQAKAATLVEELLLARGTPALLAPVSTGLALVLKAPGASELVLQLRRAVSSRLARRVVAGVSEPIGAQQLSAGLAQAVAAARASAAQRSEVTSFGDAGPLDLLLRGQPRDVLTAISESTLRPLLAWDGEHGGDLLRTVGTYLENNQQLEVTARSLGIHRHTLRQRLERITTLLDRDLADMRVRADLWLALRARSHLRTHSAEDPR